MMPKIGSSSNKKKAKKKLEKNREQLLGCDKRNERKDGAERDGEKERERSARRFGDGEEHEASAEANQAAD